MKFRCPCSGCLVEPICKDPCDKFSKFILPLHNITERMMEFFENIDDNIPQDKGIRRFLFEKGGEFIIVPIVFCFFRYVLGVKTNIKETTLFDKRYSKWEESREE